MNIVLFHKPFFLPHFMQVFEDISGNTFVQNPNAPQIDHAVKTKYFRRSKEQDHSLGLYSQEEVRWRHQ